MLTIITAIGGTGNHKKELGHLSTFAEYDRKQAIAMRMALFVKYPNQTHFVMRQYKFDDLVPCPSG